MKIDLRQIQEALDYFGIKPQAVSCGILTDVQEERRGKKAVRLIFCAVLADGRRMIVRFLNEREFIVDVSKLSLTTETLERQSAFSELLREHGMNVPKKYAKDFHYCMPYSVDGIPLDVTVEDYLGEPLQRFMPEMFYDYGLLIGQMHQISLEHQAAVGFSIVLREVQENRTDYRMLFQGTDIGQIPSELLEQAVLLHDEKRMKVAEIWPLLPKSAVQGDIYSCNNVAQTPEGIGFYDFNIAADEVLLGDMLHLWFRTVYDIDNEDEVEKWDLTECWRRYLQGYVKYRKWTAPEKENFGLAYSLLGSIYMTRYVAELLRRGRTADAAAGFCKVVRLLEADCTDILEEST